MIALMKLAVVLLTLIDAQVTLLDGKTAEGTLVRITSDAVVLNDGKELSIPLANVIDVSLKSEPAEDVPSPEASLQLRDGSQLKAENIAVTAESVTANAGRAGAVEMARSAVRAVRLQPAKAEWQAEWDAFLLRKNSKDLLIVPKRDGTGLDFLSGVVSSVTAERVPFLLDGDEIPVPLERVFGIVFSEANAAADGLQGDVSVEFSDGAVVKAAAIRSRDDSLVVTSSWGQELTVSMGHVSSIDYIEGRLHYLSDLEPVSENYFGLNPADKSWGPLFQEDRATREGISRQWKMSRDRFPNWGRPPLRLRGKTFRKGVCIFPSARIEYPLDQKYTSLQATVGVDDEVAFNQLQGKSPTAVELRLEADGQEVWRQLIVATDEPVDLNLDLTGVGTLTVIVDFGDGSSTCDYLDLADARLMVDTSAE